MGCIVYIVNPVSGRSVRGRGRRDLIESFIARKGIAGEVKVTEYSGHGGELARKALEDGASRIVCVGGDGTLNEIATEVAGSDVPLALIPMGSGNGLARHLGVPLAFEAALEKSHSRVVKNMDVGVANGRTFFNVMGFGLDAVIGQRFNQTKLRGFGTYLREGLRAVKSYRASEVVIEASGQVLRVDAYLLAVANSSQYGSNALIAPDASVSDGKLNLVSIRTPGYLGLLDLYWRVFHGRIYGSQYVSSLRSDRFLIRLSQPSFFHADGEIFAADREIAIETRPGALKVVVPEACDSIGRSSPGQSSEL